MVTQTNLFYLGGPHGSGKTTLGNEIARENPRVMIPELYSRNPKFNTDSGYRQYLKICGRAIENFEYLEIAKRNPHRIVIANRCIYDVLAYNEVYSKKEWVAEETRADYDIHAFDFFRNENQEPLAIILNPGFKVCKRHLEKRWREKGKKWREEDEEYLAHACRAYERFQGREQIFYIDHEIDLATRTEIREANEWILEMFKRTEKGVPIGK